MADTTLPTPAGVPMPGARRSAVPASWGAAVRDAVAGTFAVVGAGIRLWLRHWPVLLTLALLGGAGRMAAIWGAVEASDKNNTLGVAILVLAPLASVTAIVLMLYVLRHSLPHIGSVADTEAPVNGTTGRQRRLLDVLASVLVPFLAVYASYGFLREDTDRFINSAVADEFLNNADIFYNPRQRDRHRPVRVRDRLAGGGDRRRRRRPPLGSGPARGRPGLAVAGLRRRVRRGHVADDARRARDDLQGQGLGLGRDPPGRGHLRRLVARPPGPPGPAGEPGGRRRPTGCSASSATSTRSSSSRCPGSRSAPSSTVTGWSRRRSRSAASGGSSPRCRNRCAACPARCSPTSASASPASPAACGSSRSPAWRRC